LWASADENQTPTDRALLSPEFAHGDNKVSPKKLSRAMAVAVQQQKTRRRRGRKKEVKASPLETGHDLGYVANSALSPTSPEELSQPAGFGLGISETTPRPSIDRYANQVNNTLLS